MGARSPTNWYQKCRKVMKERSMLRKELERQNTLIELMRTNCSVDEGEAQCIQWATRCGQLQGEVDKLTDTVTKLKRDLVAANQRYDDLCQLKIYSAEKQETKKP